MADVHGSPVPNDSTAGVTCAEVEQDDAAYVWGGLESAERARIDRHRQQCSACDQRLLASERVISQLDQAQPKIAPPPELRGLVLEAIADPKISPQAAPRGSVVSTIRRLGHGFNRAARPVARPTASRSGHRTTFFAGLATGLAGAAAAAALILIFLVRPEALGLLAARQSQLGSSDQAAPSPTITFPWQAAAATTRLLDLRSTSGPGRGLLAFDDETRRGVLLLEGVSTSAGAEYAVWLVQGAQRVQLGTLTVDARGIGSFVLPEPLPLDKPERIDVAPSTSSTPGADVVLSAKF